MKRSEHDTRRNARRRSARRMRDKFPREWRDAGVAGDGFKYPAGAWQRITKVGNGRHCRPELSIGTHLVRVRRGKKGTDRAGKFYVEDPEGVEVLETELEGADDA